MGKIRKEFPTFELNIFLLKHLFDGTNNKRETWINNGRGITEILSPKCFIKIVCLSEDPRPPFVVFENLPTLVFRHCDCSDECVIKLVLPRF